MATVLLSALVLGALTEQEPLGVFGPIGSLLRARRLKRRQGRTRSRVAKFALVFNRAERRKEETIAVLSRAIDLCAIGDERESRKNMSVLSLVASTTLFARA